ncbi:MAG: family 10 glycosylhydrolase, partial [Chloroflexota bacterium]|nr:family 10 glycosylhydrolase [Chloroflexota bacterium]
LAPGHVFNRHGQASDDTWLMLRDDGEAWAGVGQQGMYYLDPGHPDAVRHTVDVYLQLLRNYNVDGIHLDQVRYYEGQPLRWGYNPTSIARFNQLYGRDPDSRPLPSDPTWVAWRRDQVTALVRRVFLEARALRPGIPVTAAVVTWGQGPRDATDWERQPPYASVLQDWRSWLEEGIVDYLVPMNYYRESGDQSAWFDSWTRWQASHPGRRGVAFGLGAYLNAAQGSLAQLERARALGGLGVALYSYAVPARDLERASDEARDAFAAQLRSVFTRPAPVPELAWLQPPAGGGLLVDVAGRPDLSVFVYDGPSQRRAWRTDSTGLAGGVDLPAGRYTLVVSGVGIDPTPVELEVQAGQTTSVRFAPGRSSEPS